MYLLTKSVTSGPVDYNLERYQCQAATSNRELDVELLCLD